MRIAVTYDDTEVYHHFGDTSYFKIYDVQDGKIINSEIVPTGEASHAALVPFLAERGVDTLLCGGLGEKAFKLLEAAGIKTYGSTKSDTDIAVQNLIDGKLIYDPNIYARHKCGCASSMKVEKTAQGILDARAIYPDCSLADLYDETTMPPELRKAHQANDKAVMQAYGFKQDMTESEIVAELMKMYQNLTK